MSCPTITIPMAFDEFTAACNRLRDEQNISIAEGQLSGDISKSGAHVSWIYDGHSTLTLTVQSKPFIISCDKANDLVKGFFQA